MPRLHSKIVKKQAAALRRRGYSIREISKELGIAKSTASLWSIHIKLSIEAKARLHYGRSAGIKKTNSIRQVRLTKVFNAIQGITENQISNLKLTMATKRLLCAFLFWGEGGKSRSQMRIINSDPILIQVYLKLFRESFSLNEEKFGATLHLHEYHNRAQQLQFWSKTTKIPMNRIGVYLKPHTGINQRLGYPGCISISYFDVHIFDALTAYYKIFARSYTGV